MHDAWRNYENAPQEGAVICPSSAIPEGKARCVEVMSSNGSFPVIATRINGTIYCYVNACPHQYLPLNYRSDSIISSDGHRFLCSAHGAAFDIKTGDCLTGDCDKLDAIPVVEDLAGNLCIKHREP
ncbi:Rieske (2Fe-2S) protein [Vreelandella titanicae]|nr:MULTISPECIES: Rieske (2Fe-2S) protein [Halomonas]NAO94800.1 Rieske 2Fe-2S domain-containing protein [Halomonas sp. MG34]QGQ71795.1 Rieske (2Fe-2S) protein [Halomonas sp. PA16-9]UEQ03782.1 Rieske (2Fe-2S) protein [Halomonas profundus]NVE88878.1 Rieske (2Fe-2S) protein [Halomonas titanicae]PKH60449.1 Rieske (2Fe-2S) protein [Halomonas sp. Choline-3u-9]